MHSGCTAVELAAAEARLAAVHISVLVAGIHWTSGILMDIPVAAAVVLHMPVPAASSDPDPVPVPASSASDHEPVAEAASGVEELAAEAWQSTRSGYWQRVGAMRTTGICTRGSPSGR